MATDADINQSLKDNRPRMEDLYSIKIVQQLAAVCTTRKTIWKQLGYELELSGGDISSIEKTCSNDEHRCSAVLERWLQKQADANWETLRKALIIVELEQLASMISQRLSKNTSPISDVKHSVTHQKLLVEPSQGVSELSLEALTHMPKVHINNPAVLVPVEIETESLVVSKEDFSTYDTVSEAFIALQTKMRALLIKAHFGDLRRACIAQKNTPGGVELSPNLVGEIKRAKNIDDLLDLLVDSPYWSWIDLRIMKALVAASGSFQAQKLLSNYKAAVFSKRLIDVLPDMPSKEMKEYYYTKIVTKLRKDPNTMTVADLWEFQSQLEKVIMDINRGVLVLEHLEEGCVETHWYIPTSLVDKAYQNARANQYQFKDYSMLYLKIGHYPVIRDPLDQTDVTSVSIASCDAATDDFQSCMDGVEDGPLDNCTVLIVAHHLTNWEQLAKCLQLTDAEMGKIKYDYPKCIEQKYQSIMLWANKNGKDGTIVNLLQHIYFAFGLNDGFLVMRIAESLKHKDFDKENLRATDQATA